VGDILQRAVDAQRGTAIVAAGRPLRAHGRIRGNILATRLRSPFVRPYRIEADTTRPRARLEPFHRPGRVGLFEGDRVAIEEGGRLLAERSGARAHAQRQVRWDELDLLYFLGYALWNYLLTPYCFIWPGFVTRELEPWNGLERLEVTYPEGFPTHCRMQVFYFDPRAILVRLDYVAEIFGGWARGAHLLEDHHDFGGFVFPRHRIVRSVDAAGHPRSWFPAAMEGWIEEIRWD